MRVSSLRRRGGCRKGAFGGHPTPASSIGWGQPAKVRWGPAWGWRRHSGDAPCLSSPQKKKHGEVMPPPPGACPAQPLCRQATRSRLENVTGSFCSRRLLQIPIRCRKREAKQTKLQSDPPRPPPARGIAVAGGRHVAPVGRAAGLPRGLGSPSTPG